MTDYDGKLRAKFTWRYEGLWVLLWSLSFIETLERPDKICDVPLAVSTIINRGKEKFILNAKVRTKKEILDQADLLYRYHWATTEARLRNQPQPSGLDAGVVYEWHYALNWLIKYLDQEWDNVSTDT